MVVTLEFHEGDAENIRKTLVEVLDGRPPYDYFKVLLEALAAAGVTTPTTARCDECPVTAERWGSETALYAHLRVDHRYPDEDAGTHASRLWRTR